SSTLSFTGMSMIISRSRAFTPSALALSGWNTSAPALRGVDAAVFPSSACAAPCSASASAHGSASAAGLPACSFKAAAASGLAADLLDLLMVGFLGRRHGPLGEDIGGIAVRVGMVDRTQHPQRTLVLVAAVFALEHRYAIHARGHGFGQVDRQHVAHLQRAHLADAARHRDELGDNVHFGMPEL